MSANRPALNSARNQLRERIWTDGEITELLEKAYSMGFDLEKGSELEQYTVSELERLVNQVQ